MDKQANPLDISPTWLAFCSFSFSSERSKPGAVAINSLYDQSQLNPPDTLKNVGEHYRTESSFCLHLHFYLLHSGYLPIWKKDDSLHNLEAETIWMISMNCMEGK